jgi:hypothetical protein
MAEKSKMAPSRIVHVARAVRADPRTVRKVVEGKPVRGLVGVAIDEELKRRGWR